VAFDYRVTIYSSSMASVLCLDAYSANDLNGGAIEYEDTPSGCGAGKISLGLTYEEVVNRGYYRGLNIVEISSGDNTLKTSAAAGANKYYVTEGTWAFDPAQGEDAQQVYFYDGSKLTMRVPVTGIGSDGGGAYITTSAPLGGGTVPAYTAGTIIGRRRYCGRIIRRQVTVQRVPGNIDVDLQGLSVAFTQAYGTFTISQAAAIDVGTAIYNSLAQFTSTHWPFFATFTATQFPTVGSTYQGTLTNVGCDQLISDALAAITSADQWFVRVGHDRLPRLVKLFTESTNTYTYSVTLTQGATEFEPTSISFQDEDSSSIFNSVLITGDTDGSTNQPVTAIVQDPTAAALVGFQIDGAPINNQGIKNVTDAANYGLGQVDQYALPVAASKLVVFTQNDTVTGTTPGGMTSGDVVRAVACVVTTGYDQQSLVTNWTSDSGIAYGTGAGVALWTTSGSPTVNVGGSPDGLNSWAMSPVASITAQSVPVPCVAGQVWTFTGWINASGISGGSGVYEWVLTDVTHNVAIASVVKASGSGTPTAVTATIPAGCTQIAMRAYAQGNAGTTGSVYFAQPNLVQGKTIAPYVVNYAAPNIIGLPTSVVTDIDLDKQDSMQTVSFAAIEPSFAAFISEAANAVSNKLRTNLQALNSIDSYCVSSNARNYTTSASSLVVAFPAFLAQFAPATTLVSIAAANVTCVARSTNWIWLLSTGSFAVYQSATPPTGGAILMCIVQMGATGWIGDSGLKASVGVFQVGVGNVNAAANLPVPTFSGVTVANGNSLNGMAADITATLTLTNVPTNGNASQVQWYFRLTGGTGTWIPYEGQNLAIASGSLYPTNPQTVNFEYGDMTNGTQYDLGIGYVGFAGYGPVVAFQSAFSAKTIAITAPYLYAGSTPTPTVSSPSATNGTSGNGIAADVLLAFTTTNQPTDASLSRIAVWVRVTSLGGSNTIGGTGFAWSPYGSQPAGGVGSASPGASYSYSFSLADLTNGQTYDFGITYENNQGGESIVGVVYSGFTAQALNLPTTGNATMPSGIATSGPNITAASHGTLVAQGSGSCGVPITFSIGDWAANAQPGWFAGFVFYWRIHGSTTAHQQGVLGASGAVSGIAMSILVPAAVTIDIGIAYQGAQSVQSAINWTAYLASIATPLISPPGVVAGTGQANLVPDGQLAHVLSSANEAYWKAYLIDGASFLALANGDSTTYGLFSWTSGSNGSGRYANSQAFNLVAGTAYTMSAYIDLINATGSGGVRVIGPVSGDVTNTNPANAATAVASIIKNGGGSGTGGTYTTAWPNGVYSTTFTPTTSGIYVFQASNSGITVGGSPIFMGQFQVEMGSTFTGFKPNTPVQTQGTDAGTTAHPAASQPVQATVTATAGAEGSFLASAAVARRHIAGNTTFNFLFNPTAAQNTSGWTTSDSTGHGVFSRDNYWGGRFIMTVPSGSLSGYNSLYYQTVTVVPSTTYTCSGNYYCNSIPSGGYVWVDAFTTVTLGTAPNLTTASNTLVPFSFTFTTGASTTSIQIRLVLYTGGTSPTVSTSCAFSSLKLEYGPVSTPHSDDTSTGLVTTTHQQTAGADGSNLVPGIIAGRHLYGGNATDAGAMVDSNSAILYTRHAPQVTQNINATVSCYGQMPYIGSGPNIHFPSGLIAFRTTGGFCRITAGSNYSITTTTGYGVFYMTWVNNGTASSFGFLDYNNASYQSTITNPAYQVIGFMQDDGGYQFMANWTHGQHMSTLQATFPIGTAGSAVTAPNSSFLTAQSSTLPTVSNLSIVSTPTSSATSYGNYGSTPTATYSKITASWSSATVYFPSAASLAIAAGSATVYVAGLGGIDPLSHLTPSQSYYLNAWIVEATAAVTLFYTPNALQVNEAQALFNDGLVSICVNQGPTTTPAQPGSGSTNGSAYTPPPPTCPAVGQIIQTKRGFVKAEEIVVGDDLLDWDDDAYNRVNAVKIVRSEIFRVVIGTEEFRVDRNHQWVVNHGKWWWPMHSLVVGDLVTAADGGEDVVTEIESLGDGEFVGIDCERHRFRMGRLIAHNMVTVEGH
jgi:hypothetical protein